MGFREAADVSAAVPGHRTQPQCRDAIAARGRDARRPAPRRHRLGHHRGRRTPHTRFDCVAAPLPVRFHPGCAGRPSAGSSGHRSDRYVPPPVRDILWARCLRPRNRRYRPSLESAALHVSGFGCSRRPIRDSYGRDSEARGGSAHRCLENADRLRDGGSVGDHPGGGHQRDVQADRCARGRR